ncbi:transposase [Streptomyces griseoruber]
MLRRAFAKASRCREDLCDCPTARGDELFDLTDALPCADGPVTAPVDLTLVAEHRRGHGAMYDALTSGSVDVRRLRQVLAGLPVPQAADGRPVLAVDIGNWLRPDASTSADRLFCHVYGRSGRSSDQFIPELRLTREAAAGLRRPWEKPADSARLSPARVRRGFRNLRPHLPCPARAPNPQYPDPEGHGSKNRRSTTHYDVGKTTRRPESIIERDSLRG